VLSAVAESRLQRLGIPLVPGQTVDWHGLSLRIVRSDAAGALAALLETLRAAITDTVHGSVAAGFGPAFACAFRDVDPRGISGRAAVDHDPPEARALPRGVRRLQPGNNRQL
jgi:hypothetical protein